jgi:hypothetical protein
MLSDVKLSTPLEIEQLHNEKTRLEEESHNLDEELKQLEIRSKILGEKIAIQELKNENAAKRQTISQLASKISMLETQLEKLATGDTFKEDAANGNAENPEAATETTNFSEGEHGQDEDTIRVMALDNEEEIIENAEAEQQKGNQELFY